MKNAINIKSLGIGLVLGVAIVLSLGATATTEQRKLEYRHLPMRQKDAALNSLSDEGWTVLCVAGTSSDGGFYLLTRPRE